jgi:hypothetical protein
LDIINYGLIKSLLLNRTEATQWEAAMLGTYVIFERFPDGKLVFVESTEGLEQAKLRFFHLSESSQRKFVIWDPARGHEVALTAATAG